MPPLPEARYGAWTAAFIGIPAATIAAWFVTRGLSTGGPAGAGLAVAALSVGAWRTSTWVTRHVPGPIYRFAPYGLAAIASLIAAPAAAAGGPLGTLAALILALLAGVGGTTAAIRAIGKRVDKVTPFTYAVAVFWAETRAPRPAQPTTRDADAPSDIETATVTTREATTPTML